MNKCISIFFFLSYSDIVLWSHYHEIKLMNHTMKTTCEGNRAKTKTKDQISENQFGSMPRRSTMNAIFSIR